MIRVYSGYDVILNVTIVNDLNSMSQRSYHIYESNYYYYTQPYKSCTTDENCNFKNITSDTDFIEKIFQVVNKETLLRLYESELNV